MMMYKSYAVMLGESFRKSVDDIDKNGDALSARDEAFKSGYWMALHRVYTLMEQAAGVYGVPLEDISLEGLSEDYFIR